MPCHVGLWKRFDGEDGPVAQDCAVSAAEHLHLAPLDVPMGKGEAIFSSYQVVHRVDGEFGPLTRRFRLPGVILQSPRLRLQAGPIPFE